LTSGLRDRQVLVPPIWGSDVARQRDQNLRIEKRHWNHGLASVPVILTGANELAAMRGEW